MTSPAPAARARVTLRAALPSDCESVWRWNFAADVRARSKRAQTVAFADHERWFAGRIVDEREPIWVIEEDGVAVGVVRLDVAATGFTRISIALEASARGRGIGKAAVVAACRARHVPMLAEIFADNLASRGCFEACGFRSVVECDGLMTYHWDPEI
jgi:L-amino acid N-acyltransferase YncA